MKDKIGIYKEDKLFWYTVKEVTFYKKVNYRIILAEPIEFTPTCMDYLGRIFLPDTITMINKNEIILKIGG